jgi:hypothetical protein
MNRIIRANIIDITGIWGPTNKTRKTYAKQIST